MKRTAVALLSILLSTAAMAEDFDPGKTGLGSETVGDPMFCQFLRNAVEGKKKVWQCVDGTTRYGETNIWGVDGVARRPEPRERTVFGPPEDTTIELEAGALLTVKVVTDQTECYRTGRHRHCDRFSVPTFSYLMTKDEVQCEYIGSRIAARQRAVYSDLEVIVKVTFECEGGDTDDFMVYPIPGMPSIMGMPGGL